MTKMSNLSFKNDKNANFELKFNNTCTTHFKFEVKCLSSNLDLIVDSLLFGTTGDLAEARAEGCQD